MLFWPISLKSLAWIFGCSGWRKSSNRDIMVVSDVRIAIARPISRSEGTEAQGARGRWNVGLDSLNLDKNSSYRLQNGGKWHMAIKIDY